MFGRSHSKRTANGLRFGEKANQRPMNFTVGKENEEQRIGH